MILFITRTTSLWTIPLGVHILCFTVMETNHPLLRSNLSLRVQRRGLYFEALLHWSPQPNPLLPMVCCPFQNKWGSKYLKFNPTAFLVMQMYLSLSSSYIIPRFMTQEHHDLSLLRKPRRNANFPCIHLPPRNPFDGVQTWKKFKSIRLPLNKQKIKQEFTSDFEDDPEGSSGAEVKGDNDYELPMDVSE